MTVPIYSHPAFGSEVCHTCGKPAELVIEPYYRWRHCGQTWVKVKSPMDVANELRRATNNDMD